MPSSSLLGRAADRRRRKVSGSARPRRGELGMSEDRNYQNILVARQGPVGIVTLNRPQALNALNAALIAELGVALDGFEADEAIGAIVLTGNERAFAAG